MTRISILYATYRSQALYNHIYRNRLSTISRPLFALLALFAMLTAGPVYAAQTLYPLTIKDGMGNSVTLQREPQKVSSKTLFTDEILLSILEHKRLSSITRTAGQSEFSNVADKLPAGLPQLDLNVEAIINNYPDLVFAANWSDAGKIAQLKQAGIAVYLVDTPTTLDGIRAEITKLAGLLNVSDRGAELLAEMQQQLDALATERQQISKKQWVALDYNTWGTSSGADTTWNAVLDAAGISNAAADYQQGDFGQVPMSKELIVAIDPDVLFLPSWIYGDDAAKFKQQVLSDPALQSVAAIKTGRVFQIPEALRGTYSQYIIDTVQFVVKTTNASL